MKTFRDLTIGSDLYILESKKKIYSERDSYGNLYNSGKVNRTEKVQSLEKGKEGELLINKYSNYHNQGWSYSIMKTDKSMFETKDGMLIFSDKDVALGYIKDHILAGIKYEEQLVQNAKETCDKRLQEIRKSYWDILNYRP